VQPNSVVNYPGAEPGYTRVVEYKHFLDQDTRGSVTVKEFSKVMGPGDDPYYPVPNARNLALYEAYRALAAEQEAAGRVHFVGRLANYKYFNMDATIVNALEMFYNITGLPLEL